MIHYRVSVRSLAEFTAKRGDLDHRFTPTPTPEEGMLGQQIIRQRRQANYESEIRLEASYPGMTVTGRADGYDPRLNRLEEVKTHRIALHLIRENQQALHWAQAKLYGWMLCKERQLDTLTIAVCYYNLMSGEEVSEPEVFTSKQLQSYFNQQCEAFLSWAEAETAHRARRNISLQAMLFPHARYRTGQRELAEAVYRSARDRISLLAQATTGIGKTLATVFPQLKAMGEHDNDRLFFLTAKTPGRQLALDALDQLRKNSFNLQLRVLELVARDKACLHQEKACHGDSCPLAQGFYDRLPAARLAAAEKRWLTHESIQQIAQTHHLCPYYLGMEMAKWSDVIVGDYNYYFDLSAILYALTVLNEWRVTILVDEAHNLVDRARGMYTVSLDLDGLREAKEVAPKRLGTAFRRVEEAWHRAYRDQANPYQLYESLPEELTQSLQRLTNQLTDYLSERPVGNDAALMRLYFDAMVFLRLAESLGDHSVIDVALSDCESLMSNITVTLRNILPAPFLEKRFSSAVSTTLFSATLQPSRYFQDMLGLPQGTQWLDVPSPFSPEQLEVRIASHLSTRYVDRAANLIPICEVMAEQFQARPGNYLAFFSSFAFLEATREQLLKAHPDIPVLAQQARMSEAARHEFLSRFTASSRQIGFCVLGGAFGEGVDLPGDRLIGAFITTLGMPAISDVNEVLQQRMEARFGQGFEYAYLYPGLQKVVQACGRVIRSETDQGVIVLMDDRYAASRVVSLLPSWWNFRVSR